MYGIFSIYGFSAYPDEFGYWSPAAAILGYDWSEITGLGSFYSYGYSLLLVPILFLFHNAITAYRVAVILNLIFQCIAVVLIYRILSELFPGEKKEVRSIIATMAALYPAWLFYVQTTMVEALLYFVLILSIYMMLKFLKNPSILGGGLLVLIIIYLYLLHMRCLGTIAATGLTVLLWLLSQRQENGKKLSKAWIILPVLVLLFAVTFILKDKVIAILYHKTSDLTLSWNDYSGILYRLQKIISLEGIGYLFKDICGKVLYMGLATFGIAYFGIVGCVRRAVVSFKAFKKKEASYIDFLWIYILLIVIFQFLVALIYLNGASAPYADRLDNFLHGRYIDFFLPILISIGLEEMLRGKRQFVIFESSFLIMMLLSLVGMYVISTNDKQMVNAHGFTMIGMSFFLEKPLLDTVDYYYKEVILSVGLTLLVDIIVIVTRSIKQEIIISFVLIIQVILGVQACTHYIFDSQLYVHQTLLMGDRLQSIIDQYPDKKVVHIYEGGAAAIELVQFMCRDVKISVYNAEYRNAKIKRFLDDDTILIICEDQDYEKRADRFYKEKLAMGGLIMYYNP